jgi:hypothetical protein
MSFFNRISNGWKIAMGSFKVLRENKQLIAFPVLSAISLILVMGAFYTGLLAIVGWDLDNLNTDGVTGYLLLFGFYLINYFIVVFFNMALVHCTRLYFQGEEVTIEKGLKFSLSRVGVIFSWAVFAATVGTILKAIQENSGIVGKIITGILGIVWNVAVFFVVPIIAYEGLGPVDAFKRSSKLMKEKWGESIAGTFSLGLVQFVGILLVAGPLFFLGLAIHILAGIVLAVLGAFVVIAIVSAAETIFISMVYHDINGDPVKYLNEQMVNDLFVQK